jgi:lipoate-protein ligase A
VSGALWRVLVDPPAGAAWNMSVDEALWLEVQRTGRPILRLYRWERPALSLGYRQRAPEWLARAERLGVEVVRRASGGGSVLHAGDLTYAVVAPASATPAPAGALPADMRGSSRWIQALLLDGLRRAGVAAVGAQPVPRAERAAVCFAGSTGTEIDCAGAKLVGSAQRRARFGFLQHGSIRVADDSELCAMLFGADSPSAPAPLEVSPARICESLQAALRDRVDGALEASQLDATERQHASMRSAARARDPLCLPLLSLRPAPLVADRDA